MGPVTIRYSPARIGGQVSAVTVTASELTVLEVKGDAGILQESQVSVFADAALAVSGGNTQIKLRYYVSFDAGSTYYQTPIKNLATGQLANTPSIIDSTSPAKVVEDFPLSGANAFKITGQTDAGTATLNFLTAMFRSN